MTSRSSSDVEFHPVHIIENQEDRLVSRARFELADKRLQGQLTLSLGIDGKRRIPIRSRQTHQFGEQRSLFWRAFAGLRQEELQLVELGFRFVFASEAGRALDLCDERIKVTSW